LIVRSFLNLFILSALLAFSIASHAEVLSGHVIAVADGDSLTLLDANKQTFKIRLAAIDAPEKNQAYGTRAKQSLSKICFGKNAEAIVTTKDRYQRYVAEIYCAGVNANETQIATGMAWVYLQYAKGFDRYKELEDAARKQRLGLWADDNPIPPWQFRRQK